MKKIFLFVNVDWFFYSHRLPIAAAALKKKFDMTVYSEITRNDVDLKKFNFKMNNSPLSRVNKNFLLLFKEFILTFKVLYQNKPQVVHAVTVKPIIFVGFICAILKIPFIASITGLGPVFKPKNNKDKIRLLIVKNIYRFILSRKNVKVICQTEYDAQQLISQRITHPDRIVFTAGSGVNLNTFKSLRKTQKDTIKILMAARLIKEKGLLEYCEAAKAINQGGYQDIKFLLSGPVDSYARGAFTLEQVKNICAESGVEFLGNIAGMQNILGDTDIFVLPSYYPEGIPKVLLEAAASGCAVITTDHPGCRSGIEADKTGLLVKPMDVESLVVAIKNLTSNRNLIREMGRAGRCLAERKFSDEKIVAKHFAVYNEMAKTPNRK